MAPSGPGFERQVEKSIKVLDARLRYWRNDDNECMLVKLDRIRESAND
jgi:hypothetical protein